jgi:hypothetical protein
MDVRPPLDTSDTHDASARREAVAVLVDVGVVRSSSVADYRGEEAEQRPPLPPPPPGTGEPALSGADGADDIEQRGAWVRAQHESGVPFFHNLETRESSWEPPSAFRSRSRGLALDRDISGRRPSTSIRGGRAGPPETQRVDVIWTYWPAVSALLCAAGLLAAPRRPGTHWAVGTFVVGGLLFRAFRGINDAQLPRDGFAAAVFAINPLIELVSAGAGAGQGLLHVRNPPRNARRACMSRAFCSCSAARSLSV